MIHLTFTGPLAGQPFCGCNKGERIEAGDTFAHVPYTNVEAFLARPDICPSCKAEWDAAETDPADLVRDLLKVIDMLMPGVGAIAVSDYALLNDAQVRARAWLASQPEA